jgi:hypothetical protein
MPDPEEREVDDPGPDLEAERVKLRVVPVRIPIDIATATIASGVQR